MKMLQAMGAALVVASMLPGAAGAQSDQDPRRAAYDAALKCFVANASEVGHKRDARDDQGAAYYEEKGRASFNAAISLGAKLGFDNARVNADFGLTQAVELPKFIRDPAYHGAVNRTCQALGLM